MVNWGLLWVTLKIHTIILGPSFLTCTYFSFLLYWSSLQWGDLLRITQPHLCDFLQDAVAKYWLLFMCGNDNLQASAHWQVFAALKRKSLISCSVINHFYYHSPHAFDSRANKRKPKPQSGLLMEDTASIYLYFKFCSPALFVGIKCMCFDWYPPTLYRFSLSPFVYAFPQQLCVPSQSFLYCLSQSNLPGL